jgi:hypothetical protein
MAGTLTPVRLTDTETMLVLRACGLLDLTVDEDSEVSAEAAGQVHRGLKRIKKKLAGPGRPGRLSDGKEST